MDANLALTILLIQLDDAAKCAAWLARDPYPPHRAYYLASLGYSK